MCTTFPAHIRGSFASDGAGLDDGETHVAIDGHYDVSTLYGIDGPLETVAFLVDSKGHAPSTPRQLVFWSPATAHAAVGEALIAGHWHPL